MDSLMLMGDKFGGVWRVSLHDLAWHPALWGRELDFIPFSCQRKDKETDEIQHR